jgi:hypothetical protein
MTRKEPVAKIAKALKRTDGATCQKAAVIGLSLKLALRSEHRKEGLRQSMSQSRRLLSRHAPSDVYSTIAFSCGAERSYATHARLAMSNDQRVSSGRLWRTFHVQSPSRLDKTRLDLVSRQAVELPIPASTHLLRKSGQKQGFFTRMKAEPIDQIAGDCCDLLSRRVKEWQSHRGTRCRSDSRNLDVAPSRLATRTLPGQWDKGASKNSAVNSNNEAQSPSSVYSPCLRFRSRRSRRHSKA